MPVSLIARTAMLCEELLTLDDLGDGQAEITSIRDGLREPLRVAIAGRIKAGKSTLVNALVRQRIAPTDASECTRVVASYRYADAASEFVEVRPLEGSSFRLELGGDYALPASLGLPPEEIESATVWLSNRYLGDRVVIDTPGLDSVTTVYSEATSRLLGLDETKPIRPMLATDVVLFLIQPDPRSVDMEAIQSLHARSAKAIGVLSRLDQHFEEDDPFAAAATTVVTLRETFRETLTDVFPLVALLAEGADRLTESDFRPLVMLAGLEAEQLNALLLSADDLIEADLSIPKDQRAHLLEILGIYGIRCAVEAIIQGSKDLSGLADRLRYASGLTNLERTVTALFVGRNETLKALAAFAALRNIAQQCGSPALKANMLDAIEAAVAEPLMHRLTEFQVLDRSAADIDQLPVDLRQDVSHLRDGHSTTDRLGVADGALVPDLITAALSGMARWRRFEMDARTSPGAKRLAAVMIMSFEIMYAEAAGTMPNEPTVRTYA